jgi:hypothetical protein
MDSVISFIGKKRCRSQAIGSDNERILMPVSGNCRTVGCPFPVKKIIRPVGEGLQDLP